MFNFLFARPIATLLTVAGVAVFAPVIFPIIGVILKPAGRAGDQSLSRTGR